ncbi:hypothetical protein KFK09_011698 [Dendrobium nobile]|uniref:Uncharacterized protein n=1 Tax=Dendrobium nobile TaxID=94219 RepID=A0A8T3BDL0_DENNO|nr:hypothetical protein KFK09_011698 [Dendrobium nobile]
MEATHKDIFCIYLLLQQSVTSLFYISIHSLDCIIETFFGGDALSTLNTW